MMKKAEQVVVVRPDMTMAEVGDMLEKRQFRACPVISKDGRLMGVVSVSQAGTCLHSDPPTCFE